MSERNQHLLPIMIGIIFLCALVFVVLFSMREYNIQREAIELHMQRAEMEMRKQEMQMEYDALKDVHQQQQEQKVDSGIIEDTKEKIKEHEQMLKDAAERIEDNESAIQSLRERPLFTF